jgi:hypothetical protein
MERLSTMLNLSTSYLNKMGQLNKAFSGEAGKKRLLGMRLANGRPVTWDHLESVISLYSEDGSTARFEKMLGIMVKESLSPDEVERRILTDRALHGKQPHAGGRPIVVPATPKGRLAAVLAISGLTLRKFEVHTNPVNSLAAAIRGMSQDEVVSNSQELLQESMLLRAQIRALADVCNDILLTDLDQSIQHVNRCLAVQAANGTVNGALNGAAHGDPAPAVSAGAAEASRMENEDAGAQP